MSNIILVTRFEEDAKATMGKITIPGTPIIGYSLERPGPDTTASGLRLRIPAGDYKMVWHKSAHFPMVVGNLFNEHVPAARMILIHPGNYPEDTDGCILAGTTHGKDFIGESVDKINQIYAWVRKVGIETVTVRVVNGFPKPETPAA